MEGEARDSESREAFRACGISQKAAKLGECVADIVNGSLLYAVPISQDGQVRGMMWAGDRTDSLNSILSTKAFNGESVSYLVAEDGRELLASHSTADSRLVAANGVSDRGWEVIGGGRDGDECAAIRGERSIPVPHLGPQALLFILWSHRSERLDDGDDSSVVSVYDLF